MLPASALQKTGTIAGLLAYYSKQTLSDGFIDGKKVCMANSLDKRIEQIRRDVVVCLTRVLAAVDLDGKKPSSNTEIRKVVERVGENANQLLKNTLEGKSGLQYEWIAEGFAKIDESLSKIETERVIVTRKQGRPTTLIFEDHIDEALSEINNQTSGILQCTDELFDETGTTRPTTGSLNLLHEVSGKTKVIRRKLETLKRPFLGWIYSYKLASVFLLCGLIAVPICYAYRASSTSGESPKVAVKMQLDKDKAAINEQLHEPAQSGFEKAIAVGEYVTKAVTLLPNLLVGLALFLSLIQYLFVTQRWRNGGVDGFRKDLLDASKSVKALVGKGKE